MQQTFFILTLHLLAAPLAGLHAVEPSVSRAGITGLEASQLPAAAAELLPADGIYPRGRKLCFAGYSGKPERDLANGFTVAGAVYGNQLPYLERCFSNGWPVIARIGVRGSFKDNDPAKYKVDEPTLRQEIQKQVNALAQHREVIWWAVEPEELRHWHGDEMKYLAIVTDTIRQTDPQRRPIYHYNPNNRDSVSLGPIARYVDVLAKGSYVNLGGRKRDRAWVRWSVEQEIEAIRATGRSDMIPIVMPELCQDPHPTEDKEIRAWVRHDVYLGLASGAKGVFIWSLFKRKEVARTWQLWYDGYAECARELNGERALAQVFLFGQRRSEFTVKLVKGEAAAKVTLGGDVEPSTTSAQERALRKIEVPSWTAVEYVFGGDRWLFVINSANAPASFTIAGGPKGSRVANAFDGSPMVRSKADPLLVELSAYGVAAMRFEKSE